MPAFEYQALDANGRTRNGVLEGDSARQIRSKLREQSMVPLAVEQVGDREQQSGAEGGISLRLPRRGVKAGDLALITRQMATLVRSGLPLEEVLLTVSRQTERKRLKSVMLSVRTKVTEGYGLSSALADFPHIFPDVYRTSVAAGEQSGYLDVVLERLAEYAEKRQQMRQKVQLALFYPLLLTVMAVLVTIALLGYIVPEVVQVFDNIGQELPPLTIGLIALSEAVQDYGPYAGLATGGAILVGSQLLRRPGPRRTYDLLLLRTPLLNRLVRGTNTARFARTLAIVSASGVPILEALRISSQVVGNVAMREAIEDAARQVREGGSLAKSLESSGYFPPMTVHLIASGESGGNLTEMLGRAAESQEQEMETTTSVLVGLFEPALILIMGAVVLTIVMAILLPIFEINQLVQ
ncbi:general secretion pathway protein F [Halorhodospira halochloris]|uniref:General secretion pathway protein F n=1 Tax=Halorhodospira halochloris TaxID=1052 RepID=A0A0X8X6K4_HALHR|nr:type II secretion system inner membrane protein GspF [Halorhodospira halochloris]MBK1650916.1 type II secretion system protein GspF [Halorhodospira halochloris]BAU56580.1 general secretion pathway protein F [Halorhodospira halochloris]